MTVVDTGLITLGRSAIIDLAGEWLIVEQRPAPTPPVPPPTLLGQFRFLKDHYIDEEYVFAGEIRQMFTPWSPTADVEPLDSISAGYFYSAGPTLGACIRTQFTTAFIYKPATYWYQLSPNIWKLSGLGAGFAPVFAIIGRIEDKST